MQLPGQQYVYSSKQRVSGVDADRELCRSQLLSNLLTTRVAFFISIVLRIAITTCFNKVFRGVAGEIGGSSQVLIIWTLKFSLYKYLFYFYLLRICSENPRVQAYRFGT